VSLLLHAWFALRHGLSALTASLASTDPLLVALWLGLNGLAGVSAGLLIWRLWLVSRYRPVAACSDAELPHITVVIPAYNEGRQVLGALRTVVESRYPAHKVQIIAVDDGSQDDTWDWIRHASRRYAGRITPIHCSRNRGKKHALAEGFRRARGSVIVTLDSDSELEPDTLRHLVAPLVGSERVGAVAGNLRVLNRDAGWIPRMLELHLTLCSDFIRAAESQLGSVLCTPGALAAYRTDLIQRLLDEWLDQRFLGRPATIGEDRALATLILRGGHEVKYQGSAIARTEMPEDLSKLRRMLLRWIRADVRETIICTTFMFRRFRDDNLLGTRINLVDSIARMCVAAVLWLPGLLYLAQNTEIALLAALATSLAGTALPFATYGVLRHWKGSFWVFPFGLYQMLVLTWLTPFGCLTPHQNGWMTRRLAPAQTRRIAGVAGSS
jgi:hyaluronan synthase